MIENLSSYGRMYEALGLEYAGGSQRVVPRLEPAPSTGNLLEMHNFGPHPRFMA